MYQLLYMRGDLPDDLLSWVISLPRKVYWPERPTLTCSLRGYNRAWEQSLIGITSD